MSLTAQKSFFSNLSENSLWASFTPPKKKQNTQLIYNYWNDNEQCFSSEENYTFPIQFQWMFSLKKSYNFLSFVFFFFGSWMSSQCQSIVKGVIQSHSLSKQAALEYGPGHPRCVDRLVLSSLAFNQTAEAGQVQCQTEWIKGEHFKEGCWGKCEN